MVERHPSTIQVVELLHRLTRRHRLRSTLRLRPSHRRVQDIRLPLRRSPRLPRVIVLNLHPSVLRHRVIHRRVHLSAQCLHDVSLPIHHVYSYAHFFPPIDSPSKCSFYFNCFSLLTYPLPGFFLQLVSISSLFRWSMLSTKYKFHSSRPTVPFISQVLAHLSYGFADFAAVLLVLFIYGVPTSSDVPLFTQRLLLPHTLLRVSVHACVICSPC